MYYVESRVYYVFYKYQLPPRRQNALRDRYQSARTQTAGTIKILGDYRQVENRRVKRCFRYLIGVFHIILVAEEAVLPGLSIRKTLRKKKKKLFNFLL